jgi:hypothetical protein
VVTRARPVSSLLLLSALAGLADACTAAPAPQGFPAQPIQTLTSRSGLLNVAVRTSPQPPTRGEQSVEYVVTDARTGARVPGLDLKMVPWMPVMNHGTSIVPSVAEVSPGTYVVSDVALFMSGEWQLRTTITGAPGGDAGGDAGAASDYVGPTFQIP